jgi:hypothetical protein
VRGIHPGIARHAEAIALRGDDRIEDLVGDAHHDAAEHLHETAVEIEGEALVAAATRQPRCHLVVQPDIEDRVHHAGHRLPGAGAAGHQQRVVPITEALARRGLDRAHGSENLVPQRAGQPGVGGQEVAARRGADREAGGTGMPRLLISARFAPLPPSSARTACQSPPTLARTAAISLNW